MSAALVDRLQDLRRRAALIGGTALALSLAGAVLDPARFYQSWLLAYLFWIAIPLGAFGFVCLHNMSGGAWGFVIRRILESAAGTMPLVALLFLPVALGLGHLYPWADPEAVAASELLQHKAAYLNVPFFLARAALYLGLWIGASSLVVGCSRRQDEGGPEVSRLTRRLQLMSGAGLPLYALTVSFAAIDWAMTLEPDWYSTVFGMLFVAGQGLATLAFAILALAWLHRYEPLAGIVRPSHFGDLGNLTLAFVMLWAYLSFSQYLIIWSGNLPEEILWYLHRSHGGWQLVGPLLMAFHFAVPFVLLLSRERKRRARAVAGVAAWILVFRWVDLYWVVAPSFRPDGLSLHWLDLTCLVAIGGLLGAVFLHKLASWPLLPENDPRMHQGLGHGAPVETH